MIPFFGVKAWNTCKPIAVQMIDLHLIIVCSDQGCQELVVVEGIEVC